jgi:tetratricopeptide (TPR) repeat protein
LTAAAGPTRGARLASRLGDAAHAYEHERFDEARRLLRVLVAEVPELAPVNELYGLTLYRLGQWLPAVRQLERFRAATGSFDQHPVLADCYRALRRYQEADALWQELREASPDADLVAEGRIVAAGCLADQGRLAEAVALMARAGKRVEHPRERHLRQWYVLADLYERAGELPRAREVFRRVAAADPDAFDTRQRLRALR